jgi:hypothetical protein
VDEVDKLDWEAARVYLAIVHGECPTCGKCLAERHDEQTEDGGTRVVRAVCRVCGVVDLAALSDLSEEERDLVMMAHFFGWSLGG